MKDSYTKSAALAMTAVLVGSANCIHAVAAPMDSPKIIAPLVRPPRPAPFHPAKHAAPAIPQPEPSAIATPNAGFASSSVFSAATTNHAVTPNAQTLSGPVTLTYSGSSPAFSLTDSGSNRGLTASITNTRDASSALYGDTVGEGAGLTGYNLGTAGPGGKFEVTNAKSAQPGAFASTNGTGPALLATVTNTSSGYPAVYGQNLASASDGWGVEGDGNGVGVLGYVPPSSTNASSSAVYGQNDASSNTGLIYAVNGIATGNGIGVGAVASTGYGLLATSDSNYAVYAQSSSNYAVYAQSSTGNAIYAETDSTSDSAFGVYATAQSGNAIEAIATATDGYGVFGQSVNGIGVYGNDTGSGTGVRGKSATGLAGEFDGNVLITGEVTSASPAYTSDRNLKSDIRPIDGEDVLARVSQLPISSWLYTSAPEKRHVGPMAQDFHAAFGLNGADDRHISEVDIGGVSLAAIQELNRQMQSQMKIKDAQIAELTAQLAKFEGQTAELKTQVAEFETQSVAQSQAMASMQQAFATRMTALERRSVDPTQTVALGPPAKQRAAMD